MITKFRTEHLPFAAYIVAARRLAFLGCESLNGNGRVVFVFDDAKGEGDRVHIEFESGAEVPAVTYYDSIRRLRRVMSATLGRDGLDDGNRKFGKKFEKQNGESHGSRIR